MKKCLKRRLLSVAIAGVLAISPVFAGSALFANTVFADETKAATDEETVLVFNASGMQDGDVTTEYVVGDFVLKATGDKKFTVDGNVKSSEDGSLNFAKRLKTNGKSAEGERTISFTTGGAGEATVYMISSNKEDSSRMLSLHKDDTGEMVEGASFAAPASVGEDGKITPAVYSIPEAGTYRFMASQGINIYYIEVKYKGGSSSSVTRKNWDEVASPTVSECKINDAGTIDVDVTCELGVDGADVVRLFLFQNGYEAISQNVTESGTYTFAPPLKGNFDVKAVAYRKGCVEKESETIKVKDYKLPMATPTINWVDNLGKGSVYVDWTKIAATYDLSYREQGSNNFTTVATGLSESQYTIEGLSEGKIYEIKVVAHDEDNRTTEDSKSVTVGEPKQQWYAAAMGSATSGSMTIDGKKIDLKTADGIVEVDDITNTDKKLEISSQTNGKIADSEDGIFYYFTRINPNTENFKLTATFTVVDVKDEPDNQTGYGIYATDITGVGTKDAKYFNSVSVGQFKLKNHGYHAHGARLITGYVDGDAYNLSQAARNHNNKNAFSVENKDDSVKVGDTFTYTLEKTADGYKTSMEGATDPIVFEGVDSLMMQDEGSICVGVTSTRKVTTEISNIKFEKTAGSVGASGVLLTEPELSVYSSETTALSDYTAIASANVDGTLVISDATGKEIFNSSIKAYQVVKVNTTIDNGTTADITYTFTPDKSVENLTSYDAITEKMSVSCRTIGGEGAYVYVSPSGASTASGTAGEPYDLQTALNYALPGTTIILTDGTYKSDNGFVVGRNVSGTESAPITLVAENTKKAFLNGGGLSASDSILEIVGSYWHVYGLDVTGGEAKGILISGNNNTIEMCAAHDLGSTGIQISRHSDEPNSDEMWPCNNLIKNCDAYNNCDKGRTDADGFGIKLTCGDGNKLYGCTSHHNIDDGYDLYAKSTTGPIGAVVIENCVAFSNGFLIGDDPKSESVIFGEGNGFKLGGENMYGAHQLINSIAYNNYGKGITSNSGPNCEVINCTSFNNSLSGSAYNLSLYTKNTNPKAWILNGAISYADNGTVGAELGTSNGVIYSLRATNNYIFDGIESTNSNGVAVAADWFANTDINIAPERKADGTIDMHELLTLTDKAPADTGARLDTTSKNAVSIMPQIPNRGSSSTANNTSETTTVSSGHSFLSTLLFIIIAIIVIIVVVVIILWIKIKY